METRFQIPREVNKMRDGMVLASLLAATREYLRLMRHKKHILLRLQNTELDFFQVKGPVQMFPRDSMIT